MLVKQEMTIEELKALMDEALANAKTANVKIGEVCIAAVYRAISTKDGNIQPLSEFITRLKERGVNTGKLIGWLTSTFPLKYEKRVITGMTKGWKETSLDIFEVLSGEDWMHYEKESKESTYNLERLFKSMVSNALEKATIADEKVVVNQALLDDLLKVAKNHKLLG
jgi:hypothetical protein